MRHALIAAAILACAGCAAPSMTRLNPGQSPAVYSANRDWINAQPARRWEPGPGQLGVGQDVIAWRDPHTGDIYTSCDLTPAMRADAVARLTK